MHRQPVQYTYLDVIGEEPVEEVDVGGTQMSQILKFLNGSLLHLEQM